MIECDWQAWYDRLPGASEPPLHVVCTCEVDDSVVGLRLEPGNEGVGDEPDVVALELVAERGAPGSGRVGELEVSWTGRPGPGVERVRIVGEDDAVVEVTRPG